MDKNVIGLNAGLLWNLLANNRLWEMHELQKASGLDTPEFFAALGWLAREGKVDFGHNGENDDDTVTLMVSIYY